MQTKVTRGLVWTVILGLGNLPHSAYAQNDNIQRQGFIQKANIFLEDTRTLVDPNSPDHASATVGSIVTNRKILHQGRRSKTGGAATMVSPCYALTARHVVFGDERPMMEGRDYYHYNDFAVTLSIGNDGHGGPKWTIIADPVEFGADNVGGDDFALLHLRHCAGVDRTIGWMDWGKAEENLDVKMTGVQGDKVFGTMWNSHGQIVNSFMAKEHTFDHNLPTRHGSSGNPLYTTRLDLPPLLRALNTGTKHDQASILPTYYTYVSNTAIDADYLYQIVGGRIRDNVDWFNRTFPGRQNPQRELSSSAAANVP